MMHRGECIMTVAVLLLRVAAVQENNRSSAESLGRCTYPAYHPRKPRGVRASDMDFRRPPSPQQRERERRTRQLLRKK